MDILPLVIVFIAGIAASFVGGLTSGGGGIISLSTLIFLGLPPQVAIGTDRLGSVGYIISTIFKFFRSKKIAFTYIVPLSVICAVGGAIGSSLVLAIDKELLTKLIGIIIVVLLPLIIWKKNMGIERTSIKSKGILILGFALYFLLSIYDGFLGIAGGILVAYLFVFIFGLTYTEANATEKIPQLFNFIVGIAIFASNNIINYQYALVLLAGELIGGYAGAHYAVKKGDKVVRIAFILIASVVAIKLIFWS